MRTAYPIFQVQPEWTLEPEDMGTKAKFWFRRPGDDEPDWLFKYPRENTGEHWAEKIAAEIARALVTAHATVEFAEFQGKRGSVSKSFVASDQDLFHGNQLLERTTEGYDPEVRRAQADHSFVNIWGSFERLFAKAEATEETKKAFARLLILDAVIGNTDRHHENWGMLRRRVGGREAGGLGPSFDHASSLGRELLDTKRGLLLSEDRVGRYSEKAPGQIFWSEDAQRAPSPIALARQALDGYPAYFEPALQQVAGLRDSLITEIVDRVPSDWMSTSAREFAVQLITYNRNQLLELRR